MKHNLVEQARAILTGSLPDLPPMQDSFWSPKTFTFRFLKALIANLEKHNHPLLNACASNFVKDMLHTASAHLAQSRPLQPRDWARSSDRRACQCGPCHAVANFLKNPTQPVGRFSHPETTRKHIMQSCFSTGDHPNGYRFETVRDSRPYTLVVYKTNDMYHHARSQWVVDVVGLCRELKTMESEYLTSLLGADAFTVAAFDQAMRAECVAAGLIRPEQPISNPLSVSAQPSERPLPFLAASAEQKSHVIDLTEDDP